MKLELAKVMGGNLSRNFLRGVLKLLLAGFMTPAAFGILRSVYSLFRLLSSLANLGIEHGIIAFVSRALGKGKEEGREECNQVLRIAMLVWMAISALLLVVGNILAGFVAVTVLGDADLENYVRIVFLAVGGQLLWRLQTSYLSGSQQFGKLALLLTSAPAAMLASAGILILTDRFTLTWAVCLYLLAPLVVSLPWMLTLPRGLFGRPWWNGATARRLVYFSRWVYMSNLASANRNYLNPILLKHPILSGSIAAGETNAGIYGFGNDLAGEITVLSQSLVAVLLPKASGLKTVPQLRRFAGRSYRALAVILPLMIPLAFLAKPLLLVLGHFKPSYFEYLPCLHSFTVLYVSYLVSIAVIPMQAVLYSLRRPQVETWFEAAGIVILVGSSVLLIPVYGVEGAAYAVLGQRVLTAGAIIFFGHRLLGRAGDGPLE